MAYNKYFTGAACRYDWYLKLQDIEDETPRELTLALCQYTTPNTNKQNYTIKGYVTNLPVASVGVGSLPLYVSTSCGLSEGIDPRCLSLPIPTLDFTFTPTGFDEFTSLDEIDELIAELETYFVLVKDGWWSFDFENSNILNSDGVPHLPLNSTLISHDLNLLGAYTITEVQFNFDTKEMEVSCEGYFQNSVVNVYNHIPQRWPLPQYLTGIPASGNSAHAGTTVGAYRLGPRSDRFFTKQGDDWTYFTEVQGDPTINMGTTSTWGLSAYPFLSLLTEQFTPNTAINYNSSTPYYCPTSDGTILDYLWDYSSDRSAGWWKPNPLKRHASGLGVHVNRVDLSSIGQGVVAAGTELSQYRLDLFPYTYKKETFADALLSFAMLYDLWYLPSNYFNTTALSTANAYYYEQTSSYDQANPRGNYSVIGGIFPDSDVFLDPTGTLPYRDNGHTFAQMSDTKYYITPSMIYELSTYREKISWDEITKILSTQLNISDVPNRCEMISTKLLVNPPISTDDQIAVGVEYGNTDEYVLPQINNGNPIVSTTDLVTNGVSPFWPIGVRAPTPYQNSPVIWPTNLTLGKTGGYVVNTTIPLNDDVWYDYNKPIRMELKSYKDLNWSLPDNAETILPSKYFDLSDDDFTSQPYFTAAHMEYGRGYGTPGSSRTPYLNRSMYSEDRLKVFSWLYNSRLVFMGNGQYQPVALHLPKGEETTFYHDNTGEIASSADDGDVVLENPHFAYSFCLPTTENITWGVQNWNFQIKYDGIWKQIFNRVNLTNFPARYILTLTMKDDPSLRPGTVIYVPLQNQYVECFVYKITRDLTTSFKMELTCIAMEESSRAVTSIDITSASGTYLNTSLGTRLTFNWASNVNGINNNIVPITYTIYYKQNNSSTYIELAQLSYTKNDDLLYDELLSELTNKLGYTPDLTGSSGQFFVRGSYGNVVSDYEPFTLSQLANPYVIYLNQIELNNQILPLMNGHWFIG